MNSPFTRLGGVLVMLAVLVVAPVWGQIPTRNLVLKAHFNPYPQAAGIYGYSSCWGYVHGDGREYAVIGTAQGTAIYNVTTPDASTFVAFIPGLPSIWREMKSYRNWLYVVTEATGTTVAPGVQIIRMTDPEHPVLVGSYAVNFNHSHTVSVDTTRALLICNGTRMDGTATGMRILSLANPEVPVEIGWWPGGTLPVSTANYVHDCVPVGNRLYASSVYIGTQRIFNVTNPASPAQISSFTYPGAYYSHNSWPDSTGNYLYVTDEQNGQTLRTINISNPLNPQVVNEWTPNPQAIVHNAHVRGHELWLASYTEGVRALDVTDPAHPAEFGYADTYPGASGGYDGVWGIYPFFPSGTVIASDMETGLWVFRPTRNYGLVRVVVQGPAAGAQVFLTTQGDSTTLGSDGVAMFAPNPGTHQVLIRKFGYEDATATVDVTQGSRDTVVVSLAAKPLTTYTGIVRDAATGLPLDEAEVSLSWTHVHDHSGTDGAFDLGSVPAGTYRVEVHRPGYMPRLIERTLALSPNNESFMLSPVAVYDPFTTGAGWTVGGPGTDDNATSGVWVDVEPLGTYIGIPSPEDARVASAPVARGPASDPLEFASSLGSLGLASIKPRAGMLHEGENAGNPGQVQPNFDRSPSPDSLCFVTGQGTSPTLVNEADVDGANDTPGKTTLTSPVYDVSGMQNPVFGYWTWFYSEFGSPDDWLAVLISNDGGASWSAVDTLRGLRNHWAETTLRIADLLPPTNRMRLRFVAADFGVGSVVEAGVDDITVYDGALAPVDAPHPQAPSRLAFGPPRPNPSGGNVSLALELPRAGHVRVDVLDVSGRVLQTLRRGDAPAGMLRLSWSGRDASGRAAPAGVYFVRAQLDAERATARLMIVR